jgi:hypothetical protein
MELMPEKEVLDFGTTDPSAILQRRIGLRAWLAGMAEQKRVRRRWAIVQAYIDDSGERSHAPVLVLAGFIAPYSQWEKFIPDWQGMLDMPCRIEYFKMNEAKCAPAKPKGQFAGWSREKTDERVAIAYSVIEDHAHFQLSCIVDLDPFYKIFEEPVFERRAINPFYLASAE